MNEVLWKTGSLLLLVFLLFPICREDCKTRTIPNRWSLALLVSGLLLATAQTLISLFSAYDGTGLLLSDPSVYSPLLFSAAGALAALCLGLLCRGISRDGFGWGDVKLLPGIGAFLGLFPFLRGMALTGLLSLAAALYLLLVRHAGKTDTLPFAPFLAAGAVLSEVVECVMAGG